MRRLSVLLVTLFLVVAMSSAVSAGPKPKPGEIHVAYEMAVFKAPKGPQDPGTHLNGPGDTYRYTYIIDDKYINDPNYTLKNVVIGVHILDPEYNEKSGDGPNEWGRILIDGKPRKWIPDAYATKLQKKEAEAGPVDYMEIASDPEAGGLPPYVYFVTDLVRDDHKLVLEVINLRKDGTVDGSAPYGDFTVLRAGVHVFYTKKK